MTGGSRLTSTWQTDTIGLCDPFVRISLGEHSLKTRHVRKTLNPTWNEVLELPVDDVRRSELEHDGSLVMQVCVAG